MRISLIVAMAENGVIGVAGELPWRLPADMRFFKRTTMGHHIIMGRKTWESVGRPLVGRTNVVVSRNRALQAPGCVVVSSLDEALGLARKSGDDEAFVIGGAQLYRLAIERADRIYLTRVHGSFEGDTYFPSLNAAMWEESERHERSPDEKHAVGYAFCRLDRV